jgi:molybdopterin-biosynthesis enzyme MoeA-like protein
MAAGEAGLIIIGDEILFGSRHDLHFDHVRETLAAIGWRLAWVRILSDDEPQLTDEFSRTIAGSLPVFCFGGIGATPDDVTRQCAARAAGVELTLHPEAVAEIEAQFGEAAYPRRINMAELPQGSRLIPNPVNRVPGFSFNTHHFFPGFPEMAWPMLDWVLQNEYQAELEPLLERSLTVFEVGESELVELMEDLIARHPDVKLFSLPRLGQRRHIELGFRGRRGLDAAFDDLVHGLQQAGVKFEYGLEKD